MLTITAVVKSKHGGNLPLSHLQPVIFVGTYLCMGKGTRWKLRLPVNLGGLFLSEITDAVLNFFFLKRNVPVIILLGILGYSGLKCPCPVLMDLTAISGIAEQNCSSSDTWQWKTCFYKCLDRTGVKHWKMAVQLTANLSRSVVDWCFKITSQQHANLDQGRKQLSLLKCF